MTKQEKLKEIRNDYQESKLQRDALPRVPFEFASEVPLFSFIK